MARHLKQITAPLSGYLQKRFSFRTQGKSSADQKQLAPELELSYLLGESLLRQRFFAFLHQRKIDDPKSQLHFWNLFLQGNDVFTSFCQSSGLTEAFKQQISTGYQQQNSIEKLHYTAYCCLLWDLHQHNESSLLTKVTDQLYSHYIATSFPAEAASKTPQQLNREIVKRLFQQWQLRPEIKESYKTEDDVVSFTLLAKTAGYHTVEVITLQGKRLKPTRLAAARRLLEQLEKATVIEPPKARVANKSQPMKPLR